MVDFFKNGHREVKDRMKTRCGFFCSLVVTLSKSVLARCFWPTPERVGQKYVSVHDFGLKFLAESESAVSWSIRSTVWHLEQLAKKSTDNVTIELQKKTTTSFHAIFHLPVSVFQKIDQFFFEKFAKKKHIRKKKTYSKYVFFCA